MQKSINKYRSRGFVDLIFNWGTALRDFYDDIDVVGRVGPHRNASEIHLSLTKRAIAASVLAVVDGKSFLPLACTLDP